MADDLPKGGLRSALTALKTAIQSGRMALLTFSEAEAIIDHIAELENRCKANEATMTRTERAATR